MLVCVFFSFILEFIDNLMYVSRINGSEFVCARFEPCAIVIYDYSVHATHSIVYIYTFMRFYRWRFTQIFRIIFSTFSFLSENLISHSTKPAREKKKITRATAVRIKKPYNRNTIENIYVYLYVYKKQGNISLSTHNTTRSTRTLFYYTTTDVNKYNVVDGF